MNKGGVFVIGALLGAAAGLFLAPKSGEENREDAKEFARGCLGQSQEYYQQGVQHFQSSVSSIRPTVDQSNDQLQAKIDAARKIIAEQVAKNAAASKAAADANETIDAEAEQAEQVAEEAEPVEAAEPEAEAEAPAEE